MGSFRRTALGEAVRMEAIRVRGLRPEAGQMGGSYHAL